MILADKIIEERKRNGWSQEELAEQLDVSRQSVSKWEGAQSIPDINRIIRMAELFGVSTDYLLKDDAEREHEIAPANDIAQSVSAARRVTLAEASAYLALKRRHAPVIALATALCVLSPVCLIIFSGMAEYGKFFISEGAASGAGVVILLLMVAAAVFLFITRGNETKKYEYLDLEAIDTEYGVDGMVREKKAAFEGEYNRNIAIGVVLCIVSCVPLLLTALLSIDEFIIVSMVGVLLVMIAAAVYMFVRVGVIMGSYDRLLQEGDYTVGKKKVAPLLDRIAGVYWVLATAIYLACSFTTNAWDRTWIIWPVAAVLYAAVKTIVKIIVKAED